MAKGKMHWAYRKTLLSGFTIPELIVAMGVFMILASLATISVVGVKQRTSLETTVNILISDIKQQQLKAMIGDTEGRGVRDDYGIHPGTDAYVLFHGSTYDVGTSGSFTVNLGDNVYFTSGPDIVFLRRSGEVSGGDTSLTLRENTTGTQRIINLNRYGVVTSVN